MPFDTTTIVQIDSPYAISQIVLEPLSDAIVEEYKQKVVADFKATNISNSRRVQAGSPA